MTMHIAVVEDIKAHAEKLTGFLERYQKEADLRMDVLCYSGGTEFLKAFRKQFDLILLDVVMDGMDGIETARQIRRLDDAVAIIFVTNLAQYAVRGYEVDALDFILKPVSYFAFSERLGRALKRIRSRGKQYVMIGDRNGSQRLDLDEIYYVDRTGHSLTYHTASGDYSVIGTLKDAEKLLGAHHFMRCNNGYLVSLKHVDGVQDGCAIVNGERLLISRAKKNSFMEALTDYIGSTIHSG